MLARYRTLGAVLALREFTVADLARYSGVRESTVRTIMGRESRYVKRAGARSTGRPGGQPVVYELRSEAERELTELLRQLEGIGARSPVVDGRATKDFAPLPTALIAAEDTLLRQISRARDPQECNQLVMLATADYQSAQRAAKDPEREVAAHLEVVAVLLRLARAELSISQGELSDTTAPFPYAKILMASDDYAGKLSGLRDDLRRLLADMPELQDKRLLPDLFHRLGTSPLGSALFGSLSTSDADLYPHVLLFDMAESDRARPGDSDVGKFVRDILLRERIPFSPVTASRGREVLPTLLRHDPGASAARVIPDISPLTAFLMTVRANDTQGRKAVEQLCEIYGQLRKCVVVGDRYDAHMSNQVNSLQGRYLSVHGLQPQGLLGALSAAMTDPSSMAGWNLPFAPLSPTTSPHPPATPAHGPQRG